MFQTTAGKKTKIFLSMNIEQCIKNKKTKDLSNLVYLILNNRFCVVVYILLQCMIQIILLEYMNIILKLNSCFI